MSQDETGTLHPRERKGSRPRSPIAGSAVLDRDCAVLANHLNNYRSDFWYQSFGRVDSETEPLRPSTFLLSPLYLPSIPPSHPSHAFPRENHKGLNNVISYLPRTYRSRAKGLRGLALRSIFVVGSDQVVNTSSTHLIQCFFKVLLYALTPQAQGALPACMVHSRHDKSPRDTLSELPHKLSLYDQRFPYASILHAGSGPPACIMLSQQIWHPLGSLVRDTKKVHVCLGGGSSKRSPQTSPQIAPNNQLPSQ